MAKVRKSSTGYALVPVPVDYVLDVMRFVLQREDEQRQRREQEQLSRLVSDSDEFTRSLLTLVAAGTLETGEPSRVRDVAATLGRDSDAVIAVVRALNRQALDAGFDRVMKLGEDTFQSPDGQWWNSIVVTMRPEVAAVVLEAAAPAGEGTS